jgi:hypothetical protein
MKKLTKKQCELIKSIENYLSVNLINDSEYVKNNVIQIESNEFIEHNVRNITNYGLAFNKYKTDEVMNGKRIYLTLI